MQELDITAVIKAIDFAPSNKYEEILQNVRTILTTPKFSVPLDRNFGLSATMLDMPLPVTQAKLTAKIIDAIQRYEPRVKVVRVSYAADALDGILIPKVRVRINEA